MHYFSLIFKNLNKRALIFRGFGRKTLNEGNFEIFQKFLKKIAKMHNLAYFSKDSYKLCVRFSRVWTKNTNCLEIFRKL